MSTGLPVKEDTDVMETTEPKTVPAADSRVNRRAFIRTTGVKAEDAVKWAEGELKKVYES